MPKYLPRSLKLLNFALPKRKDAGVVDRDGLENRCTLTGTQGSNPCLSATFQKCRGHVTTDVPSIFLFIPQLVLVNTSG